MIIFAVALICCIGTAFYGFDALYHGAYLLAFLAHLCGAVIALLLLKFRMPFRSSFILLLLFCLLIPLLGAVGAVIVIIAINRKGRMGILEEYSQYINTEEYRELFTRDENDFIPDPDNLYSLADILHSNLPVARKRVAIEALAQLEQPQTVAILREALQMDSVEVRFFAASVLSKLEMRLEMHLEELKEEDRAGRQVSVISELAQACYDFVFYDIVDGGRRDRYLELALGYALDAFSLEQDSTSLALAGRVFLQQRKYEQAIAIFNLYCREYPDDSRGFLWRAEAYLSNHDYGMVQFDLMKAGELAEIPETLRGAAEFWSGGNSNGKAV